ncbi:MAG: N-acetylmuramoyl-L-alanine amidase, partial [Proteobacteria bacterium]|nr:N-acetylmuramoyl-L-alanine amidase [Pseudomonadota bacterium]
PEVDWKFGAPPPQKKTGLVNRLRYGLFQAGNSRIVLDVSSRVQIQNSFVIPPKPSDKRYRLVIDLVKATGPETAANKIVSAPALAPIAPRQALPRQEAKITASTTPRFERPGIKPLPPLERRVNRRKVIVIDPGHGGVDPGAIGRSGVFEKKLTLAAAHALKRELDRSGRYSVFLTRSGDTFLRLRDRFAVARHNKADLFISLHADTIRRSDVRGLSVYTLSEKASDREAAELAEQENKADLIAGVDLTDEPKEVTNILIDLAQRETLNQSARFARHLVEELRGVTALLRNSHRFAGFAVLKAPDVPSVLIELGFLSNGQDEKALMRPGYRKKIAVALKRAIDRYFVRVEQVERR